LPKSDRQPPGNEDDILILSDKTVNTYRYRLYDKLNIKNDVELTRLAFKFGHLDAVLI
jgi:two-component system invasion response regulator UvrY